VEALLIPQASPSYAGKGLKMPKEFLPIKDTVSAKHFRAYLRERRYSYEQIDRMTKEYGIRYCKRGPFSGRIIFPIFYEGKLVTWTGRTIFISETLRYKTLTVDADRANVLGLEPAAGNISEFLLWYDDLMGDDCEAIYIVEGPFDALRIRSLGRKLGITATCFFTSAPSKTQTELFYDLLPKYKKRYLLLDEGTIAKSMRIEAGLGDWVMGQGIDIVYLPPGIKDPGELTKKEFMQFARGA
jgi:hypothetical protein